VDGSVGINRRGRTRRCAGTIYIRWGRRRQRERYGAEAGPPANGSGAGPSPSPRRAATRRATRTKAVLDNGCWTLNGAKTFTNQRTLRRRLRGDGG